MRVILRVAGGLLGFVAAGLVVLTPIAAYINVAVEAEWRRQHPSSVLGAVGYVGLVLLLMAAFSGAAYAFLRYAFQSRDA